MLCKSWIVWYWDLPAVVPEVLVYDAPDVSCREILQAPRRTADAWRFALKPILFMGGENWLLGRMWGSSYRAPGGGCSYKPTYCIEGLVFKGKCPQGKIHGNLQSRVSPRLLTGGEFSCNIAGIIFLVCFFLCFFTTYQFYYFQGTQSQHYGLAFK